MIEYCYAPEQVWAIVTDDEIIGGLVGTSEEADKWIPPPWLKIESWGIRFAGWTNGRRNGNGS